MPSPSHYVKLALYSDDTAIIATPRKLNLLVSYLDTYLSDLQRWLRECIIVINVSKRTAIILYRAGRRFVKPRPVQFFGYQIQWVDTMRYLGMTVDT